MSGGHAHTLGAAIGLAWVNRDVVDDGSAVEVDCAGTLVKGSLAMGPRYDPTGPRMRG
jgi:glycine cleavage system aminomethyltransferase T